MLAEAPLHALPWYFGLAFFSAWAAAALGMALLVRRRLKARAERRMAVQRRVTFDEPLAEDRLLGPGGDVERW